MSAQPAPRLVLVDTESGESTEYDGTDGQTITALREQIVKLEQAAHELEIERRKQRAELSRLRNLKALTAKQEKARPLIEDVFDYWRAVCKHPKTLLTLDRFTALWEIVNGSTVDLDNDEACRALVRRMKLACDGAAFDPFMTKRKNGTAKKHDDITLVFRSADKMDEFVLRSPQAAEALRRRQSREQAARRDARLGLPDPRSLGGSWPLELRMRGVMSGCGPHWQAR